MPTMRYSIEDVPGAGERQPVAPGVYWLRFPLPFALDHINLWLLEDGEGWTLVDTGLGDPHTREFWLRNLSDLLDDRPITRIIVTHFHPDHMGQAAFLSAHFSAPVHFTAGEWRSARYYCEASDEEVGYRHEAWFMRHGLDAARAASLRQRGNGYRSLVPALPANVEIIGQDHEFWIGGRNWEVIVGRGHAPEHACLYCSEAGVLISGDQVLPRITSHVGTELGQGATDPLGDFLDSIDRLLALPAATRVLPSHGRVFEGLHDRLNQLSAHHERQLAVIEDACRTKATTAAELLPVLFNRELDSQNLMLAMSETIAHVNHLHQRKRLSRSVAGGVLCVRTT